MTIGDIPTRDLTIHSPANIVLLHLAPQVSIVVACYNAQPFLTAALQSVVQQSFQEWEMIVVNDGSTDGSLEELHALASRDSRVRVFDQPNQGQNVAANQGIQQSRAPLIARMDADDISDPNRLEQQVAFMAAHPEVGLLGGQISRLGDQRSGLQSNFPTEHQAIIDCLLKNHHAICNPAIVFRRDLFDQIGGYWEHNIAEDWDMFLRMGEVSQLANLDACVLQYRFHRASINGRRIVEAQLFNEYAADCFIRRRNHRPAIPFDQFFADHRSQHWPSSWTFKSDALSIGQYRQAIAEIYGGQPVQGICRLGMSMVMSPTRTGRRLWNITSRLIPSSDAPSRDPFNSHLGNETVSTDADSSATPPLTRSKADEPGVSSADYEFSSAKVDGANMDSR